MKPRLIAIYILSLLDLAFTLYLTHRFGKVEANPFGKLLLKNIVLVIFYKVFVVGGALALLYRYSDNTLSVIMSWVLLAVYAALLIYHISIVGVSHYILFIQR